MRIVRYDLRDGEPRRVVVADIFFLLSIAPVALENNPTGRTVAPQGQLPPSTTT